MRRHASRFFAGTFALTTAIVVFAHPAAAQQQAEFDVIKELNDRIAATRVTEANKSYRTLFDAALRLSPPPSASGEVDASFNLGTIHTGMSNWEAVSDWAETNKGMRDAILECRDKLRIGLPYGRQIDEKYLQSGMYADLAVDGDLHVQDFAYVNTMDAIAAFATAECYRLFEAGETQLALDLALAEIYVLDQLLEREFLVEKLHAMNLLSEFLECLRDMMHVYIEQISIEQFASDSYVGADRQERKGIAFELPWLRLDLLGMPEGDYIAAKAMVKAVFGSADLPDPERFASTYAKVQAAERPLTQFGAAKRWRIVALVHRSRMATEDQLRLVYEDWLRRWGVRAWDPILDLEPYYDRLNPVSCAAVTYSMRDISEIFLARRRVISAVNGTALAAALQAYKKRFGDYPDDLEKVYAQYVRKRTDIDPFDREEGGFGYRYVPKNQPLGVVTQEWDEFVEVTGGLLWAKGNNFESEWGQSHSDDGVIGDIIYWPPLRALAREQGLER